jgi:hypothetical protein
MDETMKLKYPCLVLDHDDTTVNSTATVHYPSFVEYMEVHRPEGMLTLEEYFRYNSDPGVIEMLTGICGLTEKQMKEEEAFWNSYVQQHVPKAVSPRSSCRHIPAMVPVATHTDLRWSCSSRTEYGVRRRA